MWRTSAALVRISVAVVVQVVAPLPVLVRGMTRVVPGLHGVIAAPEERAVEEPVVQVIIHHAMEEDKSVDEELDRRTEKFGKEMDNFVIDGRVAWHFIPNSIKVFVKIDLKAAAARVFADTVAGKEERSEESENISLEETMKNMEERMELNRARYKRLYGIDYLDDNNYDIVVDTTESGIEETKEKVLNQIKQYLDEKKSD